MSPPQLPQKVRRRHPAWGEHVNDDHISWNGLIREEGDPCIGSLDDLVAGAGEHGLKGVAQCLVLGDHEDARTEGVGDDRRSAAPEAHDPAGDLGTAAPGRSEREPASARRTAHRPRRREPRAQIRHLLDGKRCGGRATPPAVPAGCHGAPIGRLAPVRAAAVLPRAALRENQKRRTPALAGPPVIAGAARMLQTPLPQPAAFP
jgi:hypothetical protein